MAQVIYRPSELNFSIDDIPSRKEADKVLLCSPDFFDIVDEKNVHMQGNIGSTDKKTVMNQWSDLRNTYDLLADKQSLKEVHVLPGAVGCEDMVFCANQSFPWVKEDGERVVVMSQMRHASRQREVVNFEKFFESKGFKPLHFTSEVTFEGMGDVIPHPHKYLLYGGYGHRTMASAYEELAKMLDVRIIALELISPKFYHLDTCFVPLSEKSVMLCKEAFTNEGLEMIGQLFEHLHYIPVAEAENFFSLNAHVLDLDKDRIAILQEGSLITKRVLEEEGYEVIELDTSEFMKSGGSVFCMKMMYS